jgi:hypothetical protein
MEEEWAVKVTLEGTKLVSLALGWTVEGEQGEKKIEPA